MSAADNVSTAISTNGDAQKQAIAEAQHNMTGGVHKSMKLQWSSLEILLPVDFGGPLATLIDDSETASANGVWSSNILLLKLSLATLAGYSHTWSRLPLQNDRE